MMKTKQSSSRRRALPLCCAPRTLLALAAASVLAGCSINPNANSTGIRPSSDIYLAPTAGASAASTKGLTAPDDMWDRIRRGFAMPDLDNAEVRSREEWYAQRPDYIQRMVGRSNKYIYHVVEELERRGMPTELALLPFVESAFNPQAFSSAKAAGLWQFIPSTGKHFSLKQTAFRDDRRDVLRSTRAALDYLQRLYTMFGDWHLALAAYNWGEGSVQRAIRRNQAQGLGTAYDDLKMPTETRQYVPKLQAIKNIILNPATFNAELPDVGNHPYFEVVPIERDIDVALAARLAEISEADFRALNPASNGPLIIASVTPRILLPWESVPSFKANLSKWGQQPTSSWTAWTAPGAMTLAQVAAQTGASEAQLRQINRIPARGSRVRAGASLLVPRQEGQTSANIPSEVADSGAPSYVTEIVLRRSGVRARKGDTIASIARRYGLSATTVAQWNRTSGSARLKPGQSVVLYLPKKTRAAASARASVKGKKSRSAATRTRLRATIAPGARAAAAKKTPASRASSKKR